MEEDEVGMNRTQYSIGSVVRKWVLEASTSINGPWTVISSHPEDDTFFYDVTDGQDKEKSFLY